MKTNIYMYMQRLQNAGLSWAASMAIIDAILDILNEREGAEHDN